MASNVTYVSMLIRNPDDHCTVEQRLTWVQPLLDLHIRLILFVDEFYRQRILDRPGLTILNLDPAELETTRAICLAEPHLPRTRNFQKDTLNFFCLMNSKPELLVKALPYIETSYTAYIDAGLDKICKDAGTLKRLETLSLDFNALILLPGCWPVKPVDPPFPQLWLGICWMLSGGLFFVPTRRAEEWYRCHRAALDKFLVMKCVTWEVNVWASIAASLGPELIWYLGDHDDRMITNIPATS
jgi:hypothetical protein